MKDYFKELAKKIEVDVPQQVDKRMMDSIQFQKDESVLKFGFSFALAASLAFVIYFNFDAEQLSSSVESYAISEMLENQEMYEQMDLLGQVDDVELTEEEWKILLAEEESDV